MRIKADGSGRIYVETETDVRFYRAHDSTLREVMAPVPEIFGSLSESPTAALWMATTTQGLFYSPQGPCTTPRSQGKPRRWTSTVRSMAQAAILGGRWFSIPKATYGGKRRYCDHWNRRHWTRKPWRGSLNTSKRDQPNQGAHRIQIAHRCHRERRYHDEQSCQDARAPHTNGRVRRHQDIVGGSPAIDSLPVVPPGCE